MLHPPLHSPPSLPRPSPRHERAPPPPPPPFAPPPSPRAMPIPAAGAAATSPDRPHWVFVYGSLRAGGPHNSALRDSTYLGAFRTAAAYPRILSTSYFSPTLLDQPGAGARADGEVYAVSDETLRELDVLENAGEGGRYARRALEVVHRTDPSRRARAFAYMKRDLAADLAAVPDVGAVGAAAVMPEKPPPGHPEKKADREEENVHSILDLHARPSSHTSPLRAYSPAVADHVGSSMYDAANCRDLR